MNKLFVFLLLSQGMACSCFAYPPGSVVAAVVPATAPTLVSAQLIPRGNVHTLLIGSTLQFTAYGTYSDGSVAILPDSEGNPEIAWNTSRHAVAKISLLGHVTALAAGAITIEGMIGRHHGYSLGIDSACAADRKLYSQSGDREPGRHRDHHGRRR